MIFGGLGLALNITTIVILSCSFTLIITSLIVKYFQSSLSNFNAMSRSRILWCIVILPWFVSALSVVALVFPELFQWKGVWASLHWHHIYNFTVFSWHGAFLIIFSSFCLLLLLSRLARALKIHSSMNQLNSFSKPDVLSNGCLIIESSEVNAFTSGLLNSKAFITTGLNNRLSSDENTIVQLHELAHVKNSDPLRKYIFSLLASFYPLKISGQLNASFSLAIEQLADSEVLKEIPDVALVAKTLVKVTRLQLNSSQIAPPISANCSFINTPLKSRVHYLLNEYKGKSFPYLTFIILVFAISSISTLSVDLIHHSFEQLFSH
ncbi:MAG: Zn-dependent protease with chaperone function [Oleispira sp.]|jgi:Zn-dependent protease with chaperone function